MPRLLLFLCLLATRALAQPQPLRLWYAQPAAAWTDALPIGNGRLGGMVFGGVAHERVQFNESTLWTGRPRAYARPGAAQYLPEIRQLLAAGKQAEAEALAEQHFMGLRDHEEGYAERRAAWLARVRAGGPGAVPPAGAAWHALKLPTPNGWESAGLEGLDGAVWFRSSFELPAAWAGKNLTLSLGRIRDEDFTYLNGQPVGHDEGTSKKRRYRVPAAALRPGRNELLVQVLNYFDKGGLIGVKENQPVLVAYPEGADPATGVPIDPAWQYWVQDANPPLAPTYEASYQPFGDLQLDFKPAAGPVTNYQRELDLTEAVARTRYEQGGVRFEREYLASAPGQALGVHLTASQPGRLTFTARLSSPHAQAHRYRADARTLALAVRVRDGVLRGVACLRVAAKGGRVTLTDSTLTLENVNEATLYLTAATNFKNYHDASGHPEKLARQALRQVAKQPYAAVRAAHVRDYQSLFSTFALDLGRTPAEALPTDERIRQFTPATDPALLALYVQYGRYLLISSSRTGSVPANLQGLWNDQLTPPWGSKYTTNINLEMNYWPAELLGLAPCAAPLAAFTRELAETGQATARAHYGARGWVLHHNADLWAGTAPINAANHGIWPTGSAWLATMLWQHYLFTQDNAYLRRHYPALKAAATFYLDFLTEDPRTHYLISSPSNSPEHGGLVAGPTMDHQLIRQLFTDCGAAARTLGRDADLQQELAAKVPRIAPNQVGKYGQLQEWLEDKDDPTDTHRHQSHLWGVYPGADITWATPRLMQAARTSLTQRGDGGTGWSLAWKVNLWARFRDGNHALLMLTKLLAPAENGSGPEQGGVYHNLFDAHPPFQIDGNFGGAAGVAELFLQSHTDTLELLPALPAALPSGAVRGLGARGGFIVDMRWQQGRLQEVTLHSLAGQPAVLRVAGRVRRLATRAGQTYRLSSELADIQN